MPKVMTTLKRYDSAVSLKEHLDFLFAFHWLCKGTISFHLSELFVLMPHASVASSHSVLSCALTEGGGGS